MGLGNPRHAGCPRYQLVPLADRRALDKRCAGSKFPLLDTGLACMSLNLTGLADVAERSLQQIAEIADDRRQTLDGAKHHHAHVDVRLNELEP